MVFYAFENMIWDIRQLMRGETPTEGPKPYPKTSLPETPKIKLTKEIIHKKVLEERMRRNESNDNFMKIHWPWIV